MPQSHMVGAIPTPASAVTPAITADAIIPPILLFVLATVAAAGIVLLLPGRREAALRKIGAVFLTAAGLIFGALLAKTAGGMGVYFWIFSAIAILGAVRVITHPQPVYSALYFVLTVMASAGLFVLMWAEFMAAALVLIYGGAILVTYVFVIMLAAEASPAKDSATAVREHLAEHDAISREPIIASAVGFALMGVLLFVIFDRSAPLPTPPAPATENKIFVGGTQKLGAYLFSKQLVNLELAGLILTVAMVGAIVIARKRVIGPAGEVVTEHGSAVSGITLNAPATPIDDNPHSIPVVGTENPRQKEYPQT